MVMGHRCIYTDPAYNMGDFLKLRNVIRVHGEWHPPATLACYSRPFDELDGTVLACLGASLVLRANGSSVPPRPPEQKRTQRVLVKFKPKSTSFNPVGDLFTMGPRGALTSVATGAAGASAAAADIEPGLDDFIVSSRRRVVGRGKIDRNPQGAGVSIAICLSVPYQ